MTVEAARSSCSSRISGVVSQGHLTVRIAKRGFASIPAEGGWDSGWAQVNQLRPKVLVTASSTTLRANISGRKSHSLLPPEAFSRVAAYLVQ